MAIAILTGAAAVAMVLWGVQTLLLSAPPSDAPVSTGPAPTLLLFGTVAAMLLATAVAWYRLAPIDSYYRRGVLSIVCGLATFLAGLIAAPIHFAAGGAGLLAMAVLAALGAVFFARKGR